MALLALKTADRLRIDESHDQMTHPAGIDITAGAAIQVNPTTGKWSLAKATTVLLASFVYIASRSVRAGDGLTGVRAGVVDAHDLSGMNYNAPVYLSDTDGRIADAAGTQSMVIGHVIPGWANNLGDAPDKLLKLNIPNQPDAT